MPQFFNSRSATPWKTARSVYRGGGAVKNNRGMGVALKSGGRIAAKDGDWIQKANIKKGKKIPLSKLKSAAKKGGKLGKRANLALTFRKMRKG